MCGTGVGADAGIEFDGSPPRAAGAPQHYRANPGRNDSGDLGGEGPNLRLGNAFACVSPHAALRSSTNCALNSVWQSGKSGCEPTVGAP